VEALLIPVGAEVHAVELALVREVVRAPRVAPVPGAPPWLLGLANLRGQVVPVVDSVRALGAEPLGEHSHVAVVDTPKGLIAIAATGMPGPVHLVDHAGASERAGAKGRYAIDGAVASLLDLPALVR
jgi:purine-binding chemotaxis protein CheW